jgi:hypothetical protein
VLRRESLRVRRRPIQVKRRNRLVADDENLIAMDMGTVQLCIREQVRTDVDRVATIAEIDPKRLNHGA